MRTRSHTPRTGRPRKLRISKGKSVKRRPKAKRPAQIAATMGRRRVRRARKR
jgi:hypothetical protein